DDFDEDLAEHLHWISDLDGPLPGGGNPTAHLSAGTHELEAEVEDSDGAITVAIVRVTVHAPPVTTTPPVVTITSPADGLVVTTGTPVTFTATATDALGADLSARIVWSEGGDDLLGTGASFTTTALDDGANVITASVVDDRGGRGVAVRTVTVQEVEVET